MNVHEAAASPAMGHWGHVTPSTSNNFSFSSLWSKSGSQLSNILCSPRDQLVQMSTIHCSFDQYCISRNTISHRAVAELPGVSSGFSDFEQEQAHVFRTINFKLICGRIDLLLVF